MSGLVTSSQAALRDCRICSGDQLSLKPSGPFSTMTVLTLSDCFCLPLSPPKCRLLISTRAQQLVALQFLQGRAHLGEAVGVEESGRGKKEEQWRLHAGV